MSTRINGRFRDDLKTVAAFLIILAAFFAASIPYAIWGESGLS